MSPSIPPPPPADDDGAADAPQTSELRLKREPQASSRQSSLPPVRVPPPRSRQSITTDIEQLLPISQAIKSLPRPPRMPSPETLEPTARRFPWASVAVFACALMASVGSVVHYAKLARTGDEPVDLGAIAATPLSLSGAQADAPVITDVSASMMVVPQLPSGHPEARAQAVLRSLVGASWTTHGRTRDPVLEEAEHALAVGDDRLAEALYRELGALYPARTAYGLAKVRLGQGDREAAEGWVLRAIEQRPKEPRYRELYAEILAHAGRHDEARLERALARSLRKRAKAPAR